jgi:hypothetical protein
MGMDDDLEKKLNKLLNKILGNTPGESNLPFSDSYVLTDGVPVPARRILEWGQFMADHERRRIALTEKDGIQVSTVFLGLDHNFGFSGEPVLFETMIFGGDHDGYQERYTELDEALKGHERAVALAGLSIDL